MLSDLQRFHGPGADIMAVISVFKADLGNDLICAANGFGQRVRNRCASKDASAVGQEFSIRKFRTGNINLIMNGGRDRKFPDKA